MELCLVCLYLSHWELWRFLLCLRSHFWFGAAMSVLTFGPIWRCHGTRCLRKKRATLKKLFGLPHFPYHPAVDNLCVLLPGTQEVLPEDTLEGGLHQKGYSSNQLSPRAQPAAAGWRLSAPDLLGASGMCHWQALWRLPVPQHLHSWWCPEWGRCLQIPSLNTLLILSHRMTTHQALLPSSQRLSAGLQSPLFRFSRWSSMCISPLGGSHRCAHVWVPWRSFLWPFSCLLCCSYQI